MSKRDISTLMEELEAIGAVGDPDLNTSLVSEDEDEGIELDIGSLLEACQSLAEGFAALRELATTLEEEAVSVTSAVQALHEAVEDGNDEDEEV